MSSGSIYDLADRRPTLDPDDLFAVLSNERRRRALCRLQESGTTSLSDLAATIEDPGTESPRIALHHIDLPKMDDAGLVDYDPDEGTVQPKSEIDELDLSALDPARD